MFDNASSDGNNTAAIITDPSKYVFFALHYNLSNPHSTAIIFLILQVEYP